MVRENPYLDEAHVLGADGKIPLPDASVDVIVAYAVLEHVADPHSATREIRRVLEAGRLVLRLDAEPQRLRGTRGARWCPIAFTRAS